MIRWLFCLGTWFCALVPLHVVGQQDSIVVISTPDTLARERGNPDFHAHLAHFSKPNYRKPLLYTGLTATAAAAYTGLWTLWYADYPQQGFHTFDDSQQWGGMDKLGHFSTAYMLGYLGHASFTWAGAKPATARWVGGSLGLGFLTGIEIMDGFSSQWGFSWTDMGANALGAALFIGQDLAWKEQRILPKFSFFPSEFAAKRPDLLGQNWTEQWLKDYNGQRYWLSVNVASFLPKEVKAGFPQWLNLAVGYSIRGFLGANQNPEPFSHIQRTQHWYLSFDIDLRKIPTKSPFLRTLFTAVGFIKIPAPTLEWNNATGGNFTFHPLFF
jgi:hypothetical protein